MNQTVIPGQFRRDHGGMVAAPPLHITRCADDTTSAVTHSTCCYDYFPGKSGPSDDCGTVTA